MKTLRHSYLIFAVSMLIVLPGPLQAAISQAEHDALMSLYGSTNGASWKNHTNWGGALGTEDTWFGVYTDFLNSTIVGIHLESNNLTGSIPAELGNLTNLVELLLDGNQLSESIPTQLGNMTILWNLNLSRNQLSGSIPAQLSQTNLCYLKLNDNQLTGSIPAELFSGSLINFMELDLSHNQLSGSIPPWFYSPMNLQILNLSYNQLSGSIPAGLGNMIYLQWLYLKDNRLSGEIPLQLKNLTWLADGSGLDLCGNSLSTSDTVLRDFLNTKQVGGNWETCQLKVVITGINSKTCKAGSAATIMGTGFSATAKNNKVKFGKLTATVKKATATRITTTIPTKCKKGTTYQVVVTVTGKGSSNAWPFAVK